MTRSRSSQAPRLDLYQQVTNQIIAALELIAAWFRVDATADDALARRTAETRAFEAAEAFCSDRLLEAVTENVPAIDPDRPPLPASLGDICHNGGRTQEDPCKDGCAWCAPDLATAGG